MGAALRRILWRPGPTALTGLAVGIVATALVVHWTDPFAQSAPALARVPPALRTITLGWRENAKIEGASGSLTVDVATFSLNKDGSWTVSLSLRNASTKRVLVLKEPSKAPGGRVGLTYPVESPIPNTSPSQEPLPAESITPAYPSTLAPGDSWSGWLVGRQKMPRGKALHVALGTFDAAGGEAFTWLSEHTFEIGP